MPRRLLTIALLAAGFVIGSWAGPTQAQPGALSPSLAAQIQALRAEKAARTPAQRKVSSELLHAGRMRRGQDVAPGIATLRTDVRLDASGRTLIDLRAQPTASLLARIAALGGELVSQVPAAQALRVRLPLDAVEALAAEPEVVRIRPAGRAMTRATNVSQGDIAHRADETRSAFGVDGTGIAIGVLSDGVGSLAALQASGDLPPGVTVLPGQAGSGSEGTAMLEIVHDLAPGAQLLFATAFTSQASFAANILALRAAGADVIVDDVAWFAEAVFQDDDVAAAVDQVVADGALYFSAAGNEGNLNDGTSGVWEGNFVVSGSTLGGDPVHDFGAGVVLNTVTLDSPFVFTLHWSDPLGASGNDYDLYLLNPPATQIVAASTNLQNGNDDPYEQIGSGANDAGRKLVIVRDSAAASRYLHLNANRGRLAVATSGQTSQHAGARGAVGVAAVHVGSAAGAGGVFAGTESVQTYSSDGPRRVFYEADGTPITPGDLLATGGELRAKPDLTAADCVATATPGFATFCGTSAAAPHAAAIAALLLELGATPAVVRSALMDTALDIEAAGSDRDSGAGIVEALAAATQAEPAACENGLDDDGDGLVDYSPTPGAGDPGCLDPSSTLENPECQDGVNNDVGQDTLIDFDGGASAGLPLLQQTAPDPQCAGTPWKNMEGLVVTIGGCGIGPELTLLLLGLAALRARRRR